MADFEYRNFERGDDILSNNYFPLGNLAQLTSGDARECHLCAIIHDDLRAQGYHLLDLALLSNFDVALRQHMRKPFRPRPQGKVSLVLAHRSHTHWEEDMIVLRSVFCFYGDPEWQRPEGHDKEQETLPESPKSNMSLGKQAVSDWFNECRKNADGMHDKCATTRTTWLPTRLLDLRGVPSAGLVKLTNTAPTEHHLWIDAMYATLSHVWGQWGSDELPSLRKSNLSTWMNPGVPLSTLPQTFRDAVEIASWLEVDYLWIDSLCIIQDDSADWGREAALMGEVYKNSVITMSADASMDARGGCFRECDSRLLQPIKIRYDRQSSPKSKRRHFFHRSEPQKDWKDLWCLDRYQDRVVQHIVQAPLAQRGWTLQERHLSKRVLHCTDLALIWQCPVKYTQSVPRFASSAYPAGLETVGGNDPVPALNVSSYTKIDFSGCGVGSTDKDVNSVQLRDALVERWIQLCQEYSSRAFSRESDRLPALSGLAREFANLLVDDVYAAGMWLSVLPESLLWRVPSEDGAAQLALLRSTDQDRHIPSWSWLRALVFYMEGGNSYQGIPWIPQTRVAHIISINVKPTIAKNPYGGIEQGASLEICAWTRDIVLIDHSHASLCNNIAMGLERAPDKEVLELSSYLDVPRTTSEPLICHCAFITGYSNFAADFGALLLEATELEGQYRRLGIAQVSQEARDIIPDVGLRGIPSELDLQTRDLEFYLSKRMEDEAPLSTQEFGCWHTNHVGLFEMPRYRDLGPKHLTLV